MHFIPATVPQEKGARGGGGETEVRKRNEYIEHFKSMTFQDNVAVQGHRRKAQGLNILVNGYFCKVNIF
jgi:hypothetical protein